MVARVIALLLVGLLAFAIAGRADDIGPLKGAVFGSGTEAVVVLLHGDVSKGGPADYLYGTAGEFAAAYPQATVYAVLRPGYGDRDGQTSAGWNNLRRDHYTAENNDLVAQALAAVKRPGRRLIVMGHSGGAAQLGVIIARYPGLVDTAVLVACPCDIGRWREENGRRPWSQSQSPQAFAADVPPATRVVAVTGDKDTNAFPALARDYVATLQAKGVDAQFVPIADAAHDFSTGLARPVMALVAQEVLR